eukprot:628358-Rhodomonas_salina.1
MLEWPVLEFDDAMSDPRLSLLKEKSARVYCECHGGRTNTEHSSVRIPEMGRACNSRPSPFRQTE